MTPRILKDFVHLQAAVNIDYEAWALDLCTLLDEIEMHQDDEEKVRVLLRFRFEIAKKHGMKVIVDESGQVGTA